MSELSPPIRNAARALIVRNQSVLALRKTEGRYALPGGGQAPGENLHQALQRECREEIGCQVSIDTLLTVADYLKPRNSKPGYHRHVVEFLFLCRVDDDYQAHNGPKPDKRQLDVEWLCLDKVSEVDLSPGFLKAVLPHYRRYQHQEATYLGQFDDTEGAT
ncbi:NUDIX domain-containing protein [Spongiibacter nanhainus]|uniref:NUDIX domain-containing protein n=1 Tax=Spongiibacter nanhainus TaxID=2794344 RepID=A0A7T4QZP2_9GAMM|nr:NUDIX domain-containing protein [Spongiibacter nanhainus]QQD17741.1 NUDIX domain-containing protein [Spongiibacter nanhainus]